MPLQPPKENGPLCVQHFKDWTRDCGAKKVQCEYEAMSEQAKENKRPIFVEMATQGYKDFNAFQKSCERFPVKCWPTEFSELGSGYVLYFHFLASLAGLLLVFWVTQLPAMIVYAQAGDGCDWSLYSDSWKKLYDSSYNHTDLGACDSSEVTIARSFLSPGNLGPNAEESGLIPTFYTVGLIIMCLILLGAYQDFALTDKLVDAMTTSPADFAITVSGLPVTATDEAPIKQWFVKNALRDKECEIVKVVIGWDAKEFREKMMKMRGLAIARKELEAGTPEFIEVTKQMMEINNDLSSASPERASRLKSSGVVVISFRYLRDQQECLKRWRSFWARWMYNDANPVLGFGGVLPGGELPRYPLGESPVLKIDIRQAAEPGDIVWEFLAVPLKIRLQRLAATWGVMLLFILVSFFICWGMVKAEEATESGKSSSEGGANTAWKVAALIPSLLIAITNVLITVVATILGKKEYHNTETEKDFSLALKMSLGMIMNTAGILFFVRAQPKEWYHGQYLVYEVFLMLFFTSMTSPLVNMLDFNT